MTNLSAMPLLEVLSHAIRGVIVAAPGKALYVADFSSIEARVVMWLAGERHALELFRTGADIYLDMAADIYRYPCTKAHTKERALGKVTILAGGFGMGWKKFQETCAKFGIVISDEFAQQVIQAYREKYWRVKELWNAQENAAIAAVSRPGRAVVSGLVSWQRVDRFLYCTLPSGRRLAYPDPEVHTRSTPWGAERPALTFMGINTYTRKWERQATYGGSCTENITQAVARDLLAHALLSCEEDGRFLPCLHAHDEVVAEGEIGLDLQDYLTLVASCPEWGSGIPLACSGFSAARYHKE